MPSTIMMAAPEVGSVAPDFSARGADMSGARSVSLKALRGQVVVLAFYPLDRSSGCTHEMEKFRDEYSTIFGSGVTVLPISEDSVASHVGWAHDAHFPFTLVSDSAGTIANEYGSMMTGRPYASRTVFVIGKDGKVVYRDMKFGALDQHAYDALTAAVAKAKTE
jgi:peroxiredoxin Q/BCP